MVAEGQAAEVVHATRKGAAVVVEVAVLERDPENLHEAVNQPHPQAVGRFGGGFP